MEHLKKGDPVYGKRGNSDRTVNRIMAHLKTFAKWRSPAFFIGRLNPRMINTIWNVVSDLAGVEGHLYLCPQ
jgi:hypothetical protein